MNVKMGKKASFRVENMANVIIFICKIIGNSLDCGGANVDDEVYAGFRKTELTKKNFSLNCRSLSLVTNDCCRLRFGRRRA
jgi:hypothetical protein